MKDGAELVIQFGVGGIFLAICVLATVCIVACTTIVHLKQR